MGADLLTGQVVFAVSGVATWLWLPPLVAFAISVCTSMVGISGAFVLVPFQMSVLGFASPSASATNLVFNLLAIPGGMYRYWRENRLFWPLALVILKTSVERVRRPDQAGVWREATTPQGRSLQGGATKPGACLGRKAGA